MLSRPNRLDSHVLQAMCLPESRWKTCIDHMKREQIVDRWDRILMMLLTAALSFFPIHACAAESGSQEAASANSYLADVSSLLGKTWPGNRTVNIVCHGHSVPAGYFKTPVVDSLNAYPHLLFSGLKERFPHAVINVIVTAIGGETSATGSSRFEKDVLAHHPDVVTIDYGLNDRGLGVEKTRTNLVSMIRKAKERNIPVILLTPTPDKASNLENPDDALCQQAQLIRELSREHQVGLVDSLAAFQAAIRNGARLDDYMSQGNHPNRKGHELVAKCLLEWFPK